MEVADRLEKVKNRLDAYYEAEMEILSSQSYRMGNQVLTRADLVEVRKAISKLENLVSELEAVINGKGRRKTLRVTLRDL